MGYHRNTALTPTRDENRVLPPTTAVTLSTELHPLLVATGLDLRNVRDLRDLRNVRNIMALLET